MENQERSPMGKVTGLWAGKPGSRLIASGTTGSIKYMVLKNEKKTESGPDYDLCLSVVEKKDEAVPRAVQAVMNVFPEGKVSRSAHGNDWP